MHVGLQTQELPGWNLKLVPSTRRVGRPKKEADHSRLVGGRFDKQGNLLTRLILGGRKASRSSYPPARILSFYRGLNGVQPRTQFRVLTHCSLEAASLKTAPAVGTVGGAYIPRRGRGSEPSTAWVNRWLWLRPLNVLLQQCITQILKGKKNSMIGI